MGSYTAIKIYEAAFELSLNVDSEEESQQERSIVATTY